MKKVIVMFLMLSVLLCGCGREESVPPETTLPAPAEETAVPVETAETDALPAELDAYRRVLEGRMTICRSASMEYIPISKISLFFTVDELPWGVERFAVQDLDGDGVQEAVLEVSNSAGFVILRYQEDGTVSGQEIWHRAFQELKADGSFRGAGSSFDSYYWQYGSDGNVLLAERYEREDGTPYYSVNGQETDAEAFAAFEAEQAAKPDAVWYESWEDFLASL